MTTVLAHIDGGSGDASDAFTLPQPLADSDRQTATIDSYDRAAQHHAARLAQADFEPYLRRFAARLPAGAVVLDGGCGGGRDLAWMAQQGFRPIGLDLSVGMLAEAHRAAPTATLLHGDLGEIPLADAAVDGVWMCASLLHLDPHEARRALREVQRVLSPGGVAFVSTAAGQGSEWRGGEFGRRWFQLYDESSLAALMTEAGLVVTDSVTEPGVVQGRWVNITAKKQS